MIDQGVGRSPIVAPAAVRRADTFVSDPFLRRVAARMVEDLPALTDELVRRLLADDPFYGALETTTLTRVKADVDENLRHVVRGFAGLEPFDFEIARALARRTAAEGIPVVAVLRVYRLGAQLIWEHLANQRAWREEDFGLDVILDGAAALWALVNSFSTVVSEEYDETAADRFRRDERERTLLVDALIEGRTADLPRLAEAARMLDLPEHGEFVVVVAENPATGAEGLPAIDRALAAAGVRSAWRLRSQRQIGIVVTGRAIERVKSTLDARAVARVGISPTFEHLADTSRHVHLADLALRCVEPGRRGVAAFDDHPLAVLVAQAPEVSRRLVALVLGPLLRPDEDCHVLLETLEAWVAEQGSTSRTALRLFCHRNTVRNRLQRVEELTGRRLADPSAVAELCLAMKGLSLSGHD